MKLTSIIIGLLPAIEAAVTGFQCDGKNEEVRTCNVGECSKDACRDCAWGEWSDWQPPTCQGLCERHREITHHNDYCGKPCEGSQVETKECEPDCEAPPIDCKLTEWTEWSECSLMCDGGQTFRSRKVLTMPENCGKACDAELSEVKPCNTKVCNEPQDCVVSEWDSWGECTATCGGGQQERKRRIETVAEFGGKQCEDAMREIQACNAQPCSEARDCVWGAWGEWSACTKTCNGGQKSRMRLIDVAPRFGGKLCTPEDMVEVARCNDIPCGEPVDGEFSDWSEWEDCSCSCNGIRQRTRHVLRFPEYGGASCFGSLKEIEGCNTGAEACDLEVKKEDPIDCVLSEWEAWTTCSKECDGGQKSRSRTVVTSPSHGGKPCHGSLREIDDCNMEPCEEPTHEVVDCAWGDWEAWGECSVSCGGGQKMRTRQIQQMPNKYGRACLVVDVDGNVVTGENDLASLEVSECNTGGCGCIDGEWGEWSEWGAATCTGLCERHRTVVVHGDECGKPAIGPKVETKRCTPHCRKPPVDCELAQWGAWSDCTSECGGGQKLRKRSIAIPEAHEGLPCGTNLISLVENRCGGDNSLLPDEWYTSKSAAAEADSSSQTFSEGTAATYAVPAICIHKIGYALSDSTVKAIDKAASDAGVFGSSFTDLPEDDTIIYLSRDGWTNKHIARYVATWKGTTGVGNSNIKILVPLVDEQVLEEITSCNEQVCAAASDCKLSEWSDWTACSASCNGGQQYRDRKILQEATNGGKPCDGTTKEIQECGTEACGNTVDCKWSDWSDWGACSASCGGGQKIRDRGISVAPRNGGKLCAAHAKTEVAACNMVSCDQECVDAEWEEWDEWGRCSASCGSGYQFRSRGVAQRASDCGKQLSGDKQEYRKCDLDPCDDVVEDCLFSGWSSWGDCSCECNGIKDRTRRISALATNGGVPCTGPIKQIEPCNTENCAEWDPVDCVIEEWSYWGDCSVSCGGGSQTRTRSILVHPKNMGKPCEGDLSEIQGCNTQRCDTAIDCKWSEWHEWGDCSKTCGGGERTRYRRIEEMPESGGNACDARASMEIEACNTHICGTLNYCSWTEWTPWGECSQSCGNGHQTRSRELVHTTEKPQTAILATSILATMDVLMGKGSKYERYHVDHLVVTFLAGMIASFVLIGGINRAVRSRLGTLSMDNTSPRSRDQEGRDQELLGME